MYINNLKPGQKIKIYCSKSSCGQGVRGKKENIVEVILDGMLCNMGTAKFLDGTPVGLFLSDGDIVFESETLNKVKNLFWDAGVNVGVIDFRISRDNEEMEAKFEILNHHSSKKIIISVVNGNLYNVYPNQKLICKLNDKEVLKRISEFYNN